MTALPSTFEKKWPTIFQVGISVVNSLVVVASASGFHAKQIVTLTAPGQPVQDRHLRVADDVHDAGRLQERGHQEGGVGAAAVRQSCQALIGAQPAS